MRPICIFNYSLGFSTNVSKNASGSLDKVAVTPLQGNVWLRNLRRRCKKDKNLKLQSLKSLALLRVML